MSAALFTWKLLSNQYSFHIFYVLYDILLYSYFIIPELEVKDIINEVDSILLPLINAVVAHTTEDILQNNCGIGECILGDLIADAFLDAVSFTA